MSSLKQKIHERFEKFRKEYAIPHSLIVDDFEYDVNAVLDEATKQIQDKDFDGWVEDDDKLETHVQLVRVKDVLAVLEGAEQK